MKNLIMVIVLSAGAVLASGQTVNSKSSSSSSGVRVTVPQAAQKKAPARPGTPAKTAAVHPAPKAPLQIPANATESADGNFHAKDASGKMWVYRKTPFGISRAPEGGVPVANTPPGTTRTPFGLTKTSTAVPATAHRVSAEDRTALVTAVASGDTIEFRRATPFGSSSWKKNKADLTEDEQKIWDREKAKGNQ